MAESTRLPPEEYIEQAYFFRVFRERLADNLPSQDVLASVRHEILSTTRVPLAIDFIAMELKHNGVMAPAFEKLSHYMTPFQGFVIHQAESERTRLTMELALSILQREAEYKSKDLSLPGLFIYHFEALSRNRMGYAQGLSSVAEDPHYGESWRQWIRALPGKLGSVEFSDLLYARSAFAELEMQRIDGSFQLDPPPLFGEKEGKIAKANRGKDPRFLFAALQRQLNYPQVPRPGPLDKTAETLVLIQKQLQMMEMRLKFLEAETSAEPDLSHFLVDENSGPSGAPKFQD